MTLHVCNAAERHTLGGRKRITMASVAKAFTQGPKRAGPCSAMVKGGMVGSRKGAAMPRTVPGSASLAQPRARAA